MVRDIHFAQLKMFQDDIASNHGVRNINNFNTSSLDKLESFGRNVPESFLRGSLRVESGGSPSCFINSEEHANEFLNTNRKEDLRIGFLSTSDEAKKSIVQPRISSSSVCDKVNKSTSPHGIRSLSICDEANERRSLLSMNNNEDGVSVSLSTNNSIRRSNSRIKLREVHEESKASEEIDKNNEVNGNKTIRKHLHVRAYKKLFTKHAKGGNHGDKCVKEKSPLQGLFVDIGSNTLNEIKVVGDVGSTKECIQDDRDLCIATIESLETRESKNTKLLNTFFDAKSTLDDINQEHKSKFNCFECGRMVPNLESNNLLEPSGEEICNHNLSAMDIESPPSMLEKLGVGDGGINNSESLTTTDRQISEENIFIVLKDSTNTQIEYNICLVCKQPGQLIYCWGKGCKRCYHLSCFNPLLRDVLPGAWLCNFCVKKKMDSGVHSVLDEIESVWDVEAGMQNGKRYFVKYKGLAHVHNRWIPESELLLDADPYLANIGKNGLKEVNKWRKEWTEPERLLQKRLVAPLEVADEYTSVSVSESSNCCIEWFVKWKGLEYDQATWELENSLLVFSSDAPKLIKDYDFRLEQVIRLYDPLRADKALQIKKDPFYKLSKLPEECPLDLDNDHLTSVNCLREFWHKSLNAVFVDGQERILKSILFVLSLQSHACRPSLIITTSGSFQLWQAEFIRLAPSVNVIMYQGDKDVRKMIQNLEFYEESGRLMFQVLLADSKSVVEDLADLACIYWESLIVDECQNSKITRYLEQLNSLNTDFKLLLFNGQLKDSPSEYRVLLSFLEAGGMMENGLVDSKANNHDAPCTLTKLKEKFSRHIVFECKTDSSKFLEYWVPVPLSNVQLEQYCSTLFSNATVLRSNLRSDVVGALHNILITVRKCCDHPYLVDGEIRGLLTKGLQGAEFLNAEVCASGKLCLLGKILQEMKVCGLRVVILFQSLGGFEKVSLGDILDDFLQQRFGVDTYERIEAGMVMAKKVDALKKFNNREAGRFIFLIEKRACLPSVKLRSVDAIILFNSDWNPLNDLRSLQKISVESQHHSIRVFRFYTSYTVEEKLLMLAKQDIILESSVDSISRNITHLLLSWGTSYLFHKLDQLHSSANPTCISEPSFDKFCLDDEVLEIFAQFPGKTETTEAIPCSVLMKAQQSGGTYSRNSVLVGETEGISLPDKDLPIFWSGLFEGRRPKWMYISQHSQRIRRRIQNPNGLAIEAMEGDEVKIKRRKINNIVDPVTLPEFSQEKGGAPEEIHKSCMLDSECGKQSLEDQRSLLLLLGPELSELCDILGLPEAVKGVAQEFLVYIINNHDVSTNQITVLQALKISLCWRAASMSRLRLARSASLSLAKKYLKFECTEHEAYSVYSKLQILKEKFSCQSGVLENLSVQNIPDDQSPPSKTVDNIRETLDGRGIETAATGNLTLGVTDGFPIGYKSSEQLISQQDGYPIGETPGKFQLDIGSLKDSPFKNQIDVIEEVFLRRSEDLVQMHQAEVSFFKEQMDKGRLKLEKTYELDLELIRLIHNDETVRKGKINALTREFSCKLGRFDQHHKQQKQKLMSVQLDMRNKEQELKYGWLEKAKTGMMDGSLDAIPRLERRFRLEIFLEALNYACRSGETSTGSEGSVEVPSNILNEREEIVRLRDHSFATPVIGDNLEHVQNRSSVEPAVPPGPSGVLPMDSGISTPQSEVLNSFSSKTTDIISSTITDDPNCLQLVPNPEQNEGALLSSVQSLKSHVFASSSSSIQEICTNEHTGPAEALTSGNNQDMDSANEVAVPASDSVVTLSPHIEMMSCNDVATSNSTKGSLPLAEHEQERFPPAGYQEGFLSHHSVELSKVPAQQEIMAVVVENEPSNHLIPENVIHSSRSQEYLMSEGIPSEHLRTTVIHCSVACDWSHSSTQHAEVLVQDTIEPTVSESEPSIQQICDDNLHPMSLQEDLPLERTRLENLRSTGIQQDEPNELFRNFPSMEWVQPKAISADPLQNELFRVRWQFISCTKKHKNKKLLLQSECEQEIEKVRRKYDILLQDAEKGYYHEKNMLQKICQKIFWHKFFAEELRLKFCDHEKDSSSSFQAPCQNSSQNLQPSWPQPQHTSRPSTTSPVPLLTGSRLYPSQTTNQASTAPSLSILRPQASVPAVTSIHSTGLSAHTSLVISSDTVLGPVNPLPNMHVDPINPRANLHFVRSPAPHLQRVRPPHASDVTLNTPLTSAAGPQFTPPYLVSSAAPSVPPNLVSTFPARFPISDLPISNACGISQPTASGPSPLNFNPPQFQLPQYAETDDLLESLLANFPATEFHTERTIDSRPNDSPDYMFLG